MTMTYYTIDDQHGTEICTGMDESTAYRRAQELADQKRESVYLRCSDDGEYDAPIEIDPET
jgi:hypothetical protein